LQVYIKNAFDILAEIFAKVVPSMRAKNGEME
jgi:hypothetical protein